MEKTGSIELERNDSFERRQWKVQHVAWVAMSLLIVAAMLGVFGSGPLSSATAGNSATIAVDYERFIRHTGEGDIAIAVAGGQAVAGEVAVWINAEWLGANQVLVISPEPAAFLAGADRHIYVFAVDDPAQGFEVGIRFTPREMGRIRGAIGIDDGPDVSFTQWSYP